MNRWTRYLILLAVASGAAAARGEGTAVRVTDDRVNLRAKPALESEVVGQVNADDRLIVKTFQDEWVEIVPPDSISFWVHRDFISGGAVQTKKLNVRAGPGINYNVVGVLARGDTVEERGQFGEWVKIAPPKSTSLWMSSEYVEAERKAIPARAARPAPQPVREPAPQPVRVARPVVVAAPQPAAGGQVVRQQTVPQIVDVQESGEDTRLPDDWELIPLDGQGKQVEREGELRPVGFLLGRPTRHRLVREEDGRLVTICYLRGNRTQLDDWIGAPMLIRGREYWVKGVEYPIIVVQQMIPRPGPRAR